MHDLVCWGKMIIDWFSLIQRDCWASEELCAPLKLVYQFVLMQKGKVISYVLDHEKQVGICRRHELEKQNISHIPSKRTKKTKQTTLVHTCSTNRRATSSTGSSSEERHYRIQLVPFNSRLSGTTLQNHFMYTSDVVVHERRNSPVCELKILHESMIKVSSKINGH